MSSDESDELQAFLRENVSSFEQLEVLLWLLRSPRKVWPRTDIAAALSLSEQSVASALDQVAPTCVERSAPGAAEPTYRLHPSAELEPLLQRLLDTYDQERLVVVQMMTQNALERVRSAAERRLADAFALKGRKL